MSSSSDFLLPEKKARTSALKLMDLLEQEKVIDFSLPVEQRDPQCSTTSLFHGKKGIMFGVMMAQNRAGENKILKSFSGQYNGIWIVKGWAPPLISPLDFTRLTQNIDPEIKALSKQIDQLRDKKEENKIVLKTESINNRILENLIKERRNLSIKLNQDIQNLYILENFNGEKSSFEKFFKGNPPTGTGDCNAPKLINYARALSLKPLSMAEFYWGKSPLSGNRVHKEFYPPCKERCIPLIPYLLTGANNLWK